jgi:thioredoxin reductase
MPMTLDCAVIGGGPAGFNAALVLARGCQDTILFDDKNPRNKVTHESHNFITRDGISPKQFRQKAQEDLLKYDSVEISNQTVTKIVKKHDYFQITVLSGETFEARNIILSTGLKDILPDIKGIHEVYGKSIFSCPFCDGYESMHEPLVYFADDVHTLYAVKIISNWNSDITICTNGKTVLTEKEASILSDKGLQVITTEIEALHHDNGHLTHVEFKDGSKLSKKRGFVSSRLEQASRLFEPLGLKVNDFGGIVTDEYGRTNMTGVYAAGDNSTGPPQLIIAAALGSKAAIGVIMDSVEKEF